MSFWCAATGQPWTWAWKAYPGVWLFIGLLALGVWRWNRAAARRAGTTAPPAHPAFAAGLVILWLSLDWPIGALGAGHLASVHMLQFLLMALVAPPLLLFGPTRDAVAMLQGPGAGRSIARWLVSPFPALVQFSVVVLATHLPAVVDTLMATQAGSMTIDLLWIGSGLAFWWPLIRDVPRHPRFTHPVKIGYVILGLMFSPVMFGLVGFLVNSETPMYRVFELAPPLPGVDARADHVLAGTLMSVGGMTVAFVAISVLFYRWNRESA